MNSTARKMNILICAGIFPPDVGGPASYGRQLAEALIARGHKVKVVTYSDKKLEDYYPFPVIRVTRSDFKPWHYFRYLLAVLRHGFGAEVLYVQDQVSAGYPTYLAGKILRKPLVIKITGDYSWEQATNRGFTNLSVDAFQASPSAAPTIRRIRRVQMRVINSANIVIVPSQYLQNLVAKWGVPRERIKVFYNSVSVPEISESKADLRERFSIAPDEFLIISAGRNVKWKGFDLLREAASELKAAHPKLRLLILSDLPQKTVHEYFKAADLFVLNSGYEGLSNTLVEALSVGVPIVSTSVGGNPEVLESGKNGILIEYNNREQLKNAILKLYQDQGLRDGFVRNGLQAVGKFSFDNMINQTEQCLSEVIK